MVEKKNNPLTLLTAGGLGILLTVSTGVGWFATQKAYANENNITRLESTLVYMARDLAEIKSSMKDIVQHIMKDSS